LGPGTRRMRRAAPPPARWRSVRVVPERDGARCGSYSTSGGELQIVEPHVVTPDGHLRRLAGEVDRAEVLAVRRLGRAELVLPEVGPEERDLLPGRRERDRLVGDVVAHGRAAEGRVARLRVQLDAQRARALGLEGDALEGGRVDDGLRRALGREVEP